MQEELECGIEELYPEYALSQLNISAQLNSWLEKWARMFNVPAIKAKVTNLHYCRYDHEKQVIIIALIDTAAARTHRDALRALEFALAHEFGHHVYYHRHGRVGSEDEVNIIAKQLTGLTEKQAWDLLEKHLPCSQAETMRVEEEESERIEQEGKS